jgi:hypothetical protein
MREAESRRFRALSREAGTDCTQPIRGRSLKHGLRSRLGGRRDPVRLGRRSKRGRPRDADAATPPDTNATERSLEKIARPLEPRRAQPSGMSAHVSTCLHVVPTRRQMRDLIVFFTAKKLAQLIRGSYSGDAGCERRSVPAVFARRGEVPSRRGRRNARSASSLPHRSVRFAIGRRSRARARSHAGAGRGTCARFPCAFPPVTARARAIAQPRRSRISAADPPEVS